MLNKKGQRELAYLVKVDEVKPIEGKDRVECAVVGGWTIMVKKNQFNPGDIGIYFEIDSKVPAKEPFEFLAAKHYKIKTQKYGKFYSQGLIMHPDDFGWKVVAGEDKCGVVDNNNNYHCIESESKFLTELLGVKYSVQEDNKRKAKEVDKYQKMAQRIGPKFKKQPYRWLMKRMWGKKLLYLFYGKVSDKQGWPDWVKKTDEERCLWKDTKIVTDNGVFRIADIVNKRLNIKVLSYNKDNQQLEYKSIIDYQRFPMESNLIKIKFPYRFGCSKKNTLICTPDHKVLTNNGWTKAKDLNTSDDLYLLTKSIPNDMIELLYGHILGDGHLIFDKRSSNTKVGFSFCQGESHKEYIEMLGKIYPSTSIRTEFSGFKPENKIYKFGINCLDNLTYHLNNDGCIKNNRFKITKEFCDRLTEKSIAIWYLDDGSCSFDGDKLRKSASISSCAFSKEENELLVDTLKNRFGLECRVDEGKYCSIVFYKESSVKLFEMIADYVPLCMKYKLPKYLRDRECKLYNLKFDFEEMLLPVKISSIENVEGKGRYVYDIEVEDNHNFIASRVLNHNCENMSWILSNKDYWTATEKVDGTSTTFTMRRYKKPFGKEDYLFLVCSRNVCFDKPDRQCYYENNPYLEMAEKYDIENKMRAMLDKHPEWEWATIQGETYGAGIQKNDYGIKEHKLAVFNFVTSDKGRWGTREMKCYMDEYQIPSVPIVAEYYILPDTVEELRKYVHSDPSVVHEGQKNKLREGIVFRDLEGVRSFKCVDPDYLVKYHE